MDYAAIFRVPATRGRMGQTVYYTATLSFGAVVKLFTYQPEQMGELEPEERYQRRLKSERIPDIARYIIDHDDYVFSSLTVSVDSDLLRFTEVEPGASLGVLELPAEARYIVNDGQHRVAGIAKALAEKPELREDTISVVILPDGGLLRSQQVFSDLNRTVQKTPRSLDILYDHRLPTHRITVDCIERVPLFAGRIDKERVSLSVTSRKFATLSGLESANAALLGSLPEQTPARVERELLELVVAFWSELTDIVPPWKSIASGDYGAHEARRRYVSSYALSLWALGSAGRTAREEADASGEDWHTYLRRLASIDWRKQNDDWQGLCMIGEEVVTRQPTRRAMGAYLEWAMGLRADKPKAVLRRDGLAPTASAESRDR